MAMAPLAWPLAGEAEFWDAKPSADWSVDETARLLTSSPWALKTRVRMKGKQPEYPSPSWDKPQPAPRPANAPVSSSASGGSTSGGSSSTGRALRNTPEIAPPNPTIPTENSNVAVAFYGEVVVSWESAAPMLLARRQPLLEEFRDRYAIRISGLPAQTFMPDTGYPPLIFRLLGGATLEAGVRRHETADYVLRMPEKKALIFAFPMAGLPLSKSDHFASFSLNLNEMMIRVRFDLRSMRFHNQPAVLA
jgi:hypothetical protein